jgi:DNA-directed RNA polymerase specialized sigma24 family protein
MSERDRKLAMNEAPEAPRGALSSQSLQALLRSLHDDPEKAAREYDCIRAKLVAFFGGWSHASSDALADEAIDRVAQKLADGLTVVNLRAYFFGVAKRVQLEAERRLATQRTALGRESQYHHAPVEEVDGAELRIDCLKRCLRKLPSDSRELILQYHRASPGPSMLARKQLATRLGVSYVNLKTRAHRIRWSLEKCVRECLQNQHSCRH